VSSGGRDLTRSGERRVCLQVTEPGDGIEGTTTDPIPEATAARCAARASSTTSSSCKAVIGRATGWTERKSIHQAISNSLDPRCECEVLSSLHGRLRSLSQGRERWNQVPEVNDLNLI
jgi:hypothetical protein